MPTAAGVFRSDSGVSILCEAPMAGTHETYRGYDIEALVFRRSARSRPLADVLQNGCYDAAVRIGRAGAGGSASEFQVVRLESPAGYVSFGDAHRAAFAQGESTVDSLLATSTQDGYHLPPC
jgi:hypothetical protein